MDESTISNETTPDAMNTTTGETNVQSVATRGLEPIAKETTLDDNTTTAKIDMANLKDVSDMADLKDVREFLASITS